MGAHFVLDILVSEIGRCYECSALREIISKTKFLLVTPLILLLYRHTQYPTNG